MSLLFEYSHVFMSRSIFENEAYIFSSITNSKATNLQDDILLGTSKSLVISLKLLYQSFQFLIKLELHGYLI